MQRVSNQLNKAKPLTNQKQDDMAAGDVVAFFDGVVGDVGTLESKTVCVFNSLSGIVVVGAGLLNTAIILAVVDGKPDPSFSANIRQFGTVADIIASRSVCLLPGSFDVALVGPALEKSKCTDLGNFRDARAAARVVYGLYRAEFRSKLHQTFPDVVVLRSIPMLIAGSAYYSKSQNQPVLFDLVRMMGRPE